ncbi:MAG: MucB/RseB C-terminal domain-containing protein [Sinobacteraceae bacterium]|nr:MucB/RseB C-terminal domain-containing protein [Nevskiaceae bacterium]
MSPASLLAGAASAAEKTNFEGVMVYRSGGATEVLHVTHRFKDGEQSEHLVTLTGTPRELIRVGNRLTCILPRGHRLDLHRPSNKNLLASLRGPGLARVGQWYRFSSLEAARVAGRKCLGVAVEPKDQYRYGYRIWLDAATKLPLRVVLMGRGAQVLEQVMFTQVAFPATIPDSAFAPRFRQDGGYRVVHQELGTDPAPGGVVTTQPADDLWRFSALPPGFRVSVRDQRPLPGKHGHVDHLMLTDGLSTVSVFSTQIETGQPQFVGLLRIGATHAYGRSLDGYHVTVVGEAPSRTIRMIGEAITPAAAASVSPSPTLAPSGAAVVRATASR